MFERRENSQCAARAGCQHVVKMLLHVGKLFFSFHTAILFSKLSYQNYEFAL